MALLLILGWGKQVSGQVEPIAADRLAPVSLNRDADSGDNQPEVWLCAGDRLADLLDPAAEWPFVKQHLTGIKFYVVRIVLDKLKAAGITLDGVTVDNPYEYLIGEFRSVNIADPKSVDWLGRVRSYEDFASKKGLAFNLIVNSQRGGRESDELFFQETLQMTDAYLKAGGRPTRWFVQSWYPFPKQIVPESAPHSMTALVKAVIQRVRSDAPVETQRKVTMEPSQAD